MKRLAIRILRLYPPRWRERYDMEMTALLEDLDVGPGDLADLLVGAVAAHFAEVQEKTKMKRMSWVAIAALLLVPVLIAASLLLMSGGHMTESGAEFLLLIAPLLVMPLMGSLSAYYPDDHPALTRATKLLGWGSAGLVSVLMLLSVGFSVLDSPMTPIPFLTQLFMLGMVGLALWFMLNGWLGLRGEMPVALGRLGIVVGMLSLVVFVTSSRAIQATLPRPAFNSVMSVVTPLWLVSLPVWAVWTGAWLWGKGRGLNHGDEDLSGFQNLTGLGKG